MSRQSELFAKPPRKAPRVIARMTDAGNFPDGRMAARFVCRKCDWSEWLAVETEGEVQRGHPCPQCNAARH